MTAPVSWHPGMLPFCRTPIGLPNDVQSLVLLPGIIDALKRKPISGRFRGVA